MPRFYFILLTALALYGCSKNQQLTGSITFSDDGSPLSAGIAVFDNGQHIARGTVKPDSTYTAGFAEEGDVFPNGQFDVSIAEAVEILPNPKKTLSRTDASVDQFAIFKERNLRLKDYH